MWYEGEEAISPANPTSKRSKYDWENEAWSVPLNVNVFQLLKVGSQIIQVGVGALYWVESPNGGPQNWGGRVQLTLLFPK